MSTPDERSYSQMFDEAMKAEAAKFLPPPVKTKTKKQKVKYKPNPYYKSKR